MTIVIAPVTRVIARAAAGRAFSTVRASTLARLPGVQRLTSTLVMKHVVHDRPLRG
jgi:hypothetical protein